MINSYGVGPDFGAESRAGQMVDRCSLLWGQDQMFEGQGQMSEVGTRVWGRARLGQMVEARVWGRVRSGIDGEDWS